jgi:dihydroxyacetone kinase-like protein
LEELNDMSGAKVGDKTMMDALIPASEAIAAYEGGDETELFAAAARAAMEGALATRGFASKFGRAKSYGEKTIGTPEPCPWPIFSRDWRGPDYNVNNFEEV